MSVVLFLPYHRNRTKVGQIPSGGSGAPWAATCLFALKKLYDPNAELVWADDLRQRPLSLLTKPGIWTVNIGPWAVYLWSMLPLQREGIIHKCKPSPAFPSVYINQYRSNGMWLDKKGMCLVPEIYTFLMICLKHGFTYHFFFLLFHPRNENIYIQQEKRIW